MIRGLPYDAELEYLEFTGTQRLLTDITPNVYGRNLKTSISYQLTSTAGRQLSGSGSSYFEFCSNGALVQADASYPADLNRHTLDFIGWETSNSSRVLYDGQNIAQGGFLRSTDTSNHFTFGSVNANSQSNPLKAKVYSLSMGYQDGTKLLDWVPVRVGTTGYMYDRVSRRLFGNAGSGAFVLGPDKAVPILSLHRYASPSNGVALGKMGCTDLFHSITAKDYVQSGLIAMWDGIENAGWGTHNGAATTWKDLVGNRDWTLGASTSYEWTANSFDAKDQFAATQDFIDGSVVTTVEVCAKIKTPSIFYYRSFAFVIIGRISATGSYYGLLYRNPNGERALMSGRSYFAGTANDFAGIATSFSFPNYATVNASGYFNSTSKAASGNNTLDYNSTTRGTLARIGGTAQQSMPIEVFNIRLYSRALTAAEIARNYAIDKARFRLP